MADYSREGEGRNFLNEVLFFLVIVILIGGYLTNSNILGNLNKSSSAPIPTQGQVAYDDSGSIFKIFSPNSTFPPAGNVKIGSTVVAERILQVRAEPAGTILGLQEKGARGKIVDGPVIAYGEIWWRVNFPDAPSGWVAEKNITSIIWLYNIINFFPSLYNYLRMIFTIISILCFVGVIYFGLKYKRFLEKDKEDREKRKLATVGKKKTSKSKKGELPTAPETPVDQGENLDNNERWQHIQALLKSFNSNDWRQAIIEADIILEEMLEKMGYDGASVADKLKNVEESDFTTLEKAWEAHKVRNRIAHSGSDYTLTQQEAERVIGLFKEVFEEFFFI
ncbi:hypothetical protein IT397_00975 [Candidatus Nomurabacteria bacterium]|nr:hypothetical protein [Candidatus Nomurabacteria bacterium]